MNKQEIFDEVLTKLRKQGHASIRQDRRRSSGSCAYRGENGDKCAIGHFISDWDYTVQMEGKNIAQLGRMCPSLAWFLSNNLSVCDGFLSRLQAAHDFYLTRSVAHWESQMEKIADSFHLHYTSPTQG